jgi:hypothetical protein
MLFLRASASILAVAVGGASASAAFEWTEVDNNSNAPSNKPDGRVIFGTMAQRRHRKAQSTLNLSDLIRCNHDDTDDPCGQQDLTTTIIIGGGGTLPPKVSCRKSTKFCISSSFLILLFVN